MKQKEKSLKEVLKVEGTRKGHHFKDGQFFSVGQLPRAFETSTHLGTSCEACKCLSKWRGQWGFTELWVRPVLFSGEITSWIFVLYKICGSTQGREEKQHLEELSDTGLPKGASDLQGVAGAGRRSDW